MRLNSGMKKEILLSGWEYRKSENGRMKGQVRKFFGLIFKAHLIFKKIDIPFHTVI